MTRMLLLLTLLFTGCAVNYVHVEAEKGIVSARVSVTLCMTPKEGNLVCHRLLR